MQISAIIWLTLRINGETIRILGTLLEASCNGKERRFCVFVPMALSVSARAGYISYFCRNPSHSSRIARKATRATAAVFLGSKYQVEGSQHWRTQVSWPSTPPGCDQHNLFLKEGRVFIVGDGGVFSLEGASARDERTEDVFFSKINSNPARGSAEIRLGLPVKSPVKILIYGVSGRLVRALLADEVLPSGETTTWRDRRSQKSGLVSPGVYFVKAEVGTYSRIHRVVIVE